MALNLGSSHPLLEFLRSNIAHQHLLAEATDLIRRIYAQDPNMEHREDLLLLSDHVSLPGPPLIYHAYIQATQWKVYLLCSSFPHSKGLALMISNPGASDNCGRPSNVSHFSILSPVHAFMVTDSQHISRRSLIYPEFMTLEQYLDRTGSTHLGSLLKDYILGLYDLHSPKCHSHGEITRQSLIVYEGRGMFLQPTSLHGTRSRTPVEFANLGRALHAVFDTRHWYQAGTRIYRLVEFMRSIANTEDCQWLKHAPFILDDVEKMNNFIPKLNDMANRNDALKTTLSTTRIYWTRAIRRFGDKHLISGYRRFYPVNGWEDHYFHLLRFLRNSLAHLNDRVPRTTRGDTRADYSSLVLNASEFARFIRFIEGRQADPCDILDTIFYEAVNIRCVIERADSYLKP